MMRNEAENRPSSCALANAEVMTIATRKYSAEAATATEYGRTSAIIGRHLERWKAGISERRPRMSSTATPRQTSPTATDTETKASRWAPARTSAATKASVAT